MSKIKDMVKPKSNQAANNDSKKPKRPAGTAARDVVQSSMPKVAGAPKPLGILGGGQLARMMALQAHKLGIPVAVYAASKEDPAAQVLGDWQLGSLDDERALRKFLKHCSVVTFESEFMDAERLARLSAEVGTKVFPSPALMGALQDRLTQKMLLERRKLPTAHFHNIKDSQAALIAFKHFGGEVVFKKRRFGYDGYGTFVVRSEKELRQFLPHISTEENGFICEQFVPFKREVAVIATRSRDGSVIRFPFVETFQENARCLWVKGPLAPNEKLEKLGRAIERFLKEIDYVGTMGIELFETRDGYLINELAPRVHNSGHFTQDAMTLDQFSAHVMAVLGRPLTEPELRSGGFAMMNLLGQSDRRPTWEIPSDVHFHWYGKSANRLGRKMGHYNVLSTTPARALALAKKRRDSFKV